MEAQVQHLQTLNNHVSDVTCCDFTAGCMLASGSMDKTVRLWEWKSGFGYIEASFSPLKEHKYGITSCTFSPQGTMLATCSRDGSTILWNTRNGSQLHKFPQVNGDAVRICKFSSDSFNLITAGDNGIICIWNLIHRTLIRSIQHHEDTVQSISYTPDSLYIITTCTLGVLKIYLFEDIRDTTIDDPIPLFSIDDAHDLGVLCSDFSPLVRSDSDSLNNVYTLITGGNDHNMKQWRIHSSYEKKNNNSVRIVNSFDIKEAHSSAITCIKYNHQGNIICTASLDKTMKMWNDEGTCLQSLDAHTRYINCVAFSRSSPILCSGSNDKTIKIWDLTGGSLNIDAEIIKPCTVLSHFGCGDLKGISSVHEDSIMMKSDMVENEVMLLKILENLHTASINSLEFSSDGYLATASGDKHVRLLKTLPDNEFLECENSPFKNHHYQINGVTFINPKLLASCSLDGNVCLWMIDQLNSRPMHILSKSYAGVKCIRSNKRTHIAAAYDDGTTALWSIDPIKATPIIVYPEHAEAATSCAFSPDDKLVCSASHNGDFRLYQMTGNNEYCDTEPVYVQDNAHDLGVQSIDFSSKCDDISIQYPDNMICHILATCGNDCHAKIWKIIIPKEDDLHHRITCSEWRTLTGHGSSLTCVRFPPNRGDLVATTSADMQTRIWSVYSGQCLHVLEHKTLVASCSFSFDGNFLATGCLDGKLHIWKLPSQLIYDSSVARFAIWNTRKITDWTSEDVIEWLKDVCVLDNSHSAQQLTVKLHLNKVTGKYLTDKHDQEIRDIFNIENCSGNDIVQNLLDELHWLHKSSTPLNISVPNNDIPHHFLCPITHDIMKDPVKCSDGFTYERRAINEWFLSGGKFVSPMTNQPLFNDEITSNRDLKKEIRLFLRANTN